MDKNNLAHTRWECKYHIVFAPKYRRKVIYQKIKANIAHILSELCKRKGIEYCSRSMSGSHSHVCTNFNEVYLKYKYGNRHFWCRGYYVDTVGKMQRRSKSISGTNYRKI